MVKIIYLLPVLTTSVSLRVLSPTTIFVANLPFTLSDQEFAEVFSLRGALTVASAQLTKKKNGRSKGYGFVQYHSQADKDVALKEFSEFTLHERVLDVKPARIAPGQAEMVTSMSADTEGREKEGGAVMGAPSVPALKYKVVDFQTGENYTCYLSPSIYNSS